MFYCVDFFCFSDMNPHRSNSYKAYNADTNMKVTHSKSFPQDIESPIIWKPESFKVEVGDIPLVDMKQKEASFAATRRRAENFHRGNSGVSLISRITRVSLSSIVSLYRSSRNAFLIISICLSISILVIVLFLVLM